jgi:hypothetical protein
MLAHNIAHGIDESDVKSERSCVQKMSKVISDRKGVRYIHVVSKIPATVRFEIARRSRHEK